MSKILRGGRLSPVREDVAKFTSSMKDDARLSKAVFAINKAHVVMLMEQKILKQSDGTKLLQALANCSNAELDASAEDVHMAVEEAVLKETGAETGGNLHIAKSRNDQVTTAIRMELRNQMLSLMRAITHVQDHLMEVAEEHVNTVILEYTHLQPAQPVTFAHYLLSYVDALERDLQRLQNAYARVNLCPLGAGALATTSFPINRDRTAELLGFSGLVENSIDAVGSRDFVTETIAALTLIAVNLSRFAEDLIIWSSPDFGVLELPDEFTSTSSIMPQKKNPEVLEVIRARASHVIGDFVASAAAVKSLPSTYNLDFQEITPKLWASIENVQASLDMFHKLLPKLKVTADVSGKANASFVAATELANLLVRKYNVPFRTAHKIVGALVKSLIEAKLTFKDATPTLLQKAAEDVASIKLTVKTEDLKALANPLALVEACRVKGGPAPAEAKRALDARKKRLLLTKSNILQMDKELEEAENKLEKAVQAYFPVSSSGNAKLKNSKL
ncbi:argininosuccinate lyase [Candidatus Bathyarchaeota archaeon A05DMB-2]|jgi:argininosuccinate lyase|nr:argininosuccinate lyase [Candidatus Bathyarchaeota archaeon A05DMB-2]